MRSVRRALIFLTVAALPACTCNPVVTDLRFACSLDEDCADGFACRGGECRTSSGDGGVCNPGDTKACAISGCSQVCRDGGLQECAPTTGGGFATNPSHCGQCGRACAKTSGFLCLNSHCTCAIDTDCPNGDVCAPGGICVSGADSCAGIKCPAGQVCRAGSCGAVTCNTGCGLIEVCDAVSSLCRPIGACRLPGICDGGFCDGDPKADGTPCDDGVACTFNDSCAAGACLGTTYSCTGGGQCQLGGSCQGDGGCAATNKVDGTLCDDGVSCTFDDRCDAGVCTGTSYTCTPNQCASTSACNGDGGCLVSPRNAGAPCDDNNPCTISDICGDAGFCNGTVYSCPAPTTCQMSVACAGDGGCIVIDKQNGAACDDGQACTPTDTCTNAICVGTGIATTYLDSDGDGHGDANITSAICPAPGGYVSTSGDCNDSNANVFQFLQVVADLDQDGVTGATTLSGQCVGDTSIVGGRTYYKSAAGAYTWLAAASATGDCNDNDGDVFQTVNVARDVDQDGITLTTSTSAQCVGATLTVSGRTYYADLAGAFTWLTAPSAAADCLDSDANVFQNISVIDDTDQDGFGDSTSSVASRCVGGTVAVGGRTYYRAVGGAYTWLLGTSNLGSDCNDTNVAITGPTAFYPDSDGDGFGSGAVTMLCTATGGFVANNTDCLEGNAFVNTTRTVFADVDQDGYTIGAAGTQCTGVTTTVGGRTYYRDSTGTYTWIATSLGTDCDDGNATVGGPVDWYADGDGDGFGTGVATNACTAPGGKPVNNNTDCNDGSGSVFTNRFVYLDADQDGYTDNAQATQCTGTSSVVNGRTYYRNSSGNFTWIATSLGGDCSTGNALVFQTVSNLVADNDRDGYPPDNTQASHCVGATSTIGTRNYYASSTAGQYWMDRADCINRSGSNCTSPFDCYDFNSSATPVQTSYFTVDRGDGSFDYNCSGAAAANSTPATYCASGGNFTFYTDGACSVGSFTGTLCSSTPAFAVPAACGQYPTATAGSYNPGACTVASYGTGTLIGCR